VSVIGLSAVDAAHKNKALNYIIIIIIIGTNMDCDISRFYQPVIYVDFQV
jgi:hypothetical protein